MPERPEIPEANDPFEKRAAVTIAVLAELRGKFRLDLFRNPNSVPGIRERVQGTLDLIRLNDRADVPV